MARPKNCSNGFRAILQLSTCAQLMDAALCGGHMSMSRYVCCWQAPLGQLTLLTTCACCVPCAVGVQTDIQQLLLAAGVDPAEEDSDGNVAATMAP